MRPTTRRGRLVWMRQRMAKRKHRKVRAELCVDHGRDHVHGLRRSTPWAVTFGAAVPLANLTFHQLHHGPMVPPVPPFRTWVIVPAAQRVPPVVKLTLFGHHPAGSPTNHMQQTLVGYAQRRVQWMSRKQNGVWKNGWLRAIKYAEWYHSQAGAWPFWDPLGRTPVG